MPKVTETDHTYLVVIEREEEDHWPDFSHPYARTLTMHPTSAVLTFERKDGRWDFRAIRVSGDKYRLLKSGEKSPRGTDSCTFRDPYVPEEYHDLIRAQLLAADRAYFKS